MYEAKGFIFHEKDGEITKHPFGGVMTSGYEEVHEVMKEMKIEHYMFILKKVNSNGKDM